MRHLAPLCMALLGASFLMPASAQAGLPGAGFTNGGKPFQRHDGSANTAGAAVPTGHAYAPAQGIHVHQQQYNHDARCMCPDCQVKRVIEKAEGAPVIIHGPSVGSSAPCVACETSATSGPIVPITHGDAPGYARVGSHAPEYAVAGVASEPTPIGVVRTNFAQQGPLNPAIAAFHGGAGTGAALGASHSDAGSIPVAPWTGVPSPKRRSVLGTMLGIRAPFSGVREAREARRAEAHAAIPMGSAAASGRVTELPASMVYGR